MIDEMPLHIKHLKKQKTKTNYFYPVLTVKEKKKIMYRSFSEFVLLAE